MTDISSSKARCICNCHNTMLLSSPPVEAYLYCPLCSCRQIEEIKERLKKLETYFEKIHADINKPYECPVCKGDGRVKLNTPLKKDNAIFDYISCHPCDGKGIVWG